MMIKKKIDKRNLRKGKTYEEIFNKIPQNMGFQKGSQPWFIKRNLSNPSTLIEIRQINREKHIGKIAWNKDKKCPYMTKRNLENNPVKSLKVREKIRQTVLSKLKDCLDYSKRKPNYKEKLLDSILQIHFPNEFKFVGDGQIIINNKNPDFINCNGKKLIIELFGRKWHEQMEEIERMNIFNQYGFHTLIVWAEELNNQQKVIGKIRNFMEVNSHH